MYEHYEIARDAAGLSNYAVCKMAGIAPSVMTDWKYGRSKSISAEKLAKIAAVLDVSLEYLLTGTQAAQEPISKAERELLRLFRLLSPKGQIEALSRIGEMAELARWKNTQEGHEK